MKKDNRIILEPENKDGPRSNYQPVMMYYEDNNLCYVCIDCPNHKTARKLIKQLLKDQEDLIKYRKKYLKLLREKRELQL